MINSSRANPTPSLGIKLNSKARSGLAKFIIIFVLGLFRFFILILSILKGILPLYTLPVSPSAQLTVTSWPFFTFSVASSVPTRHGMPSSLEMIAAWHVLPPLLVTIAEAIFIIGSQSGSVISVTRTSPFLNFEILWASFIICTVPLPILAPTAFPVTTAVPFLLNLYTSYTLTFFWLWTVSGLA